MFGTTRHNTNEYITSDYLLKNRSTFSGIIDILGEGQLSTIFDGATEYDEPVRINGWKFKESLSNGGLQSIQASLSAYNLQQLVELQDAIPSDSIGLEAICSHLQIDYAYLKQGEDGFDYDNIKILFRSILKHLVDAAIVSMTTPIENDHAEDAEDAEDDKPGPHVHRQVATLPADADVGEDKEETVTVLSQRTPEQIDEDTKRISAVVSNSQRVIEKLLADLQAAPMIDLPAIQKSCHGLIEIAGFLYAHGYIEETLNLYSRFLTTISDKATTYASESVNEHEVYYDESKLKMKSLRYLDVQYRDISIISDGIRRSTFLDRRCNSELNHKLFTIPTVLEIITGYTDEGNINTVKQVSFNPNAFFCSSLYLQKCQGIAHKNFEHFAINFRGDAVPISQISPVTKLLKRLQDNPAAGTKSMHGSRIFSFKLNKRCSIGAFDNYVEQPRFTGCEPSFHLTVIVVDLSSFGSFSWAKSVIRERGTLLSPLRDLPVVLVGTESLFSQSTVSLAEFGAYARTAGIPSICVNGGIDENIDALKTLLFHTIMETRCAILYPAPSDAQEQEDDGCEPPTSATPKCVVM